MLLLIAGYDTTAKLLSNALVAFESHPDQRALLAADPELMPAGIEEVLRWQSTVPAIPRRATRDGVLAGTEIAAGDVVYAVIAAANRDPARWTDPDRFDVERERRAHFGFGLWLASLPRRATGPPGGDGGAPTPAAARVRLPEQVR